MVSTRSTKRRSPPATEGEEPPTKAAKTPEKPKPESKQPLSSITTVLLDIEGTICPITFVKDVLFPYFLSALPDHLEKHWSSPTLTPYLNAFPPDHASNPAALVAHATDLVIRDVKAPYLKALQGHLWEDGYRSGAYAAPVYADVLEFLDRWPGAAPASTTTKPDAQRQVAIYSSGSVPAQKLFLEHVRELSSSSSSSSASASSATDEPAAVLDKRPLIADYFDTVNAGPKQSSASYTTIAKQVGRDPSEILFLSDNVGEVRAAIEAGMQSIVVEREGNAPLSDQDRKELEVISTFDDLNL